MEENMKKPLLSIIVPVYNIIDYLPRCVRSITAQTYERLEILLVDDGSTDGTSELCDLLAEEDGRIRVFHKENGGSSSARNLGIRNSVGEYLGFVDSDDYIEPEMYEQLLGALCTHEAQIAQVGRDEIDEEGRPLPDICTPPEAAVMVTSEDFMRELLMHRGDCSFCTKLIRRDLLQEKVLFPEDHLNEDFHLLVRLLTKCDGIVSLPFVGYHVFYRMGSNSRRVDKNDFSRVYRDCVENADMVTELVTEHFAHLDGEALRFGVFQRLEYLLHIPISQMTKENHFYREIVGWMRKNWARSMANPYLTPKNKCYHTLFALAPKGIRRLHAALRGL